MIICYLGDATSIHTQRWANHFAEQGLEIHLISFGDATIPNVRVHALNAPGQRNNEGDNWQLLTQLPAIRRLLNQIQPDIVHAHYLTSYGLLAALSTRKPLVSTAWGSDILVTPKRSLVYRLLLRLIFAKSRIITSDSSWMGEVALSLGLSQAKLKIIPLGVDLTKFHQQGRTWPSTPPYTMLHMRFLDENANTPMLLQAMPDLLTNMSEIKLIITHQGPELVNLREQVKQFKLNNAVVFKGLLPHNQVPELLQSSDIYFSLLTSDATSVNLLEAMACGIFPITSDIPANREWINDGENGFLIPIGDSQKLRACILEALNKPHLRKQAAIHNHQLIQQRANWETNMQSVSDIYSHILG